MGNLIQMLNKYVGSYFNTRIVFLLDMIMSLAA